MMGEQSQVKQHRDGRLLRRKEKKRQKAEDCRCEAKQNGESNSGNREGGQTRDKRKRTQRRWVRESRRRESEGERLIGVKVRKKKEGSLCTVVSRLTCVRGEHFVPLS